MRSDQLLDSFGRTIASFDPHYLRGRTQVHARSWKSEPFDTMMKPSLDDVPTQAGKTTFNRRDKLP
jgi:hypothetical protein